MKKEKLWAIYVEKNPQFAGKGNVTLSTKGLRKLFDTTWDIAYQEGEEEIEYSPICDDQAVEKLRSILGI
jgi:hypothetical protein